MPCGQMQGKGGALGAGVSQTAWARGFRPQRPWNPAPRGLPGQPCPPQPLEAVCLAEALRLPVATAEETAAKRGVAPALPGRGRKTRARSVPPPAAQEWEGSQVSAQEGPGTGPGLDVTVSAERRAADLPYWITHSLFVLLSSESGATSAFK